MTMTPHHAVVLALLFVMICTWSCSALKTSTPLLRSRSSQSSALPLPVQHYLKTKSSTSLQFGSSLGDFSGMLADSGLTQSSQLLAEEGYSNLSLYGTLALYVLTLPGLFSLVTRSVKVKVIQKDYDLPGPKVAGSKPVKMVAAEVMAFFKALNYEMTAAEDVITFKGVMGRSNSQAYFLTFCTFCGLGSLALVLSILIPDIGSYFYAMVLLSPYAGIFYWNNAQREDVVKIKMETADNEMTIGITAQGGKEDLERFSKALELSERGMEYVKGIFEGDDSGAAKKSAVVTFAPKPPTPAPTPVSPSTVTSYSMTEGEEE